MAEDFHDFEFELDPPSGRFPAWGFKTFQGRAFRSAIEASGLGLIEGETLEAAFQRGSDKILEAARRKVVAVEGMVDEPVPVVGPDIVL